MQQVTGEGMPECRTDLLLHQLDRSISSFGSFRNMPASVRRNTPHKEHRRDDTIEARTVYYMHVHIRADVAPHKIGTRGRGSPPPSLGGAGARVTFKG